MTKQIEFSAERRDWRRAIAPLMERAFWPDRANLFHWASWAVTLGIVLTLSAILLEGRVFGWEQDVSRKSNRSITLAGSTKSTNERLTDVEWVQGLAMVLGIAGAFWLSGSRGDAGLILFTLPLHVLGNFPKGFVDRDRPSDEYEGIEGFGGSMSFTSGHSEFVITFWGLVLYLVLLRITHGGVRAFLTASWLALVACVVVGRLHEGAHWPLDVVGGLVVGAGLLSALVWLRRHLVASADEPA